MDLWYLLQMIMPIKTIFDNNEGSEIKWLQKAAEGRLQERIQ